MGSGERNFAPPDPTQPASYFRVADIASGLRAPLRQPSLLHDLIYPRTLHSLTGPPEAGKTVLCLYLALIAMRDYHRNVLFIDEEAGAVQNIRILAALGADPELIDKHLTYLAFPSIRLMGPDIDGLHELLRDKRPALTVMDSSSAMMSVAGIDENKAGDVTRFWSELLLPFAHDYGCSVVITDHDSRGGESRYARGSSAKLAATEVAFKLWPVRPFSRAQDGLLRLSVVKDRPGWLHRHFQVRVSRQPLSLHFVRSTEPQPDEKPMSAASQQVLDVLSDTPVPLVRINELVASKYGHGYQHKVLLDALSQLVDARLADRLDVGAGKAVLWAKTGNSLDDASP